MNETMSDLYSFLVQQVKAKKPTYSDDECLIIANEIIRANFPKCLEKFAKGEEWKL
jgi:hypothetical protein